MVLGDNFEFHDFFVFQPIVLWLNGKTQQKLISKNLSKFIVSKGWIWFDPDPASEFSLELSYLASYR